MQFIMSYNKGLQGSFGWPNEELGSAQPGPDVCNVKKDKFSFTNVRTVIDDP